MSRCRTFAKRSSTPTIQGCIQSSHIDQTNPCSNTKTPILSKFSPCSPLLSQLVTAHSHRLARTTNPFSTLYQNPPLFCMHSPLALLSKNLPIPSSNVSSQTAIQSFRRLVEKLLNLWGPAWCSTRRLSQWLDYLLPPQRLCVPREAFTITTKKSALPSTGPLHSDNVSTRSVLSSQCSKVHRRHHSGVALNQISLLFYHQ